MPSRCVPCNKSFKKSSDLERHYRDSPKHKIPTQTPPLATSSGSTAPQVTAPAIQTTTQSVKSPWTEIPVSEYGTVLNELSEHCHSLKELEEYGYTVRPYNPLDPINAGRCTQCRLKQKDTVDRECTFHPSKRGKRNSNKPYACCGTVGKGCKTLPEHSFRLAERIARLKGFRQTPAASAQPKFRAVALDCEMAGVLNGASEVIKLCATDFVTGVVLVNSLVCPSENIIAMRSSIHGITKSTLQEAASQGQALAGWAEARSELWKYIDDDTILVGHALHHDLNDLRMIHPRVVDSSILSRNAVGPGRTHFGLHMLCSELLSVKIRTGKGGIHDALEDVLAAREAVLFCTRARNKEAFQEWAEARKHEEIRLEMKRKVEKRLKKSAAKGKGRSNRYTNYDDDEDEEILRWSDIAEDLGWPHPDTGYDPWSD
ncbi:ribonuclease H-like domain-containing protein [Nemania sp. NC0429]|nr:ribonuclease H-like domain-containing protein [Nemania sp. NC0429]